MSFSGDVKEELFLVLPHARHCKGAEFCALWDSLVRDCGEQGLEINFQNTDLERKFFTLLKKTTNIKNVLISEQKRGFRITLTPDEAEAVNTVREEALERNILHRDCCRRAYLRGLFLSNGSMSDPKKEYHLEFVCDTRTLAERATELLRIEGIEAKIVQRKKYDIVYVKDSAEIVDLLNLMGAHKALMSMENERILKEIANQVNRQVNCETSNLRKTVTASSKQIEDIEYIKTHGGLGKLPESLRKMAIIRMENRDATLRELGERMDPPVGKSGVNHRLLRICEIAEKMRKESSAEP